jgi:4-diphosphocytidyl-2-C-methyl-D-erythritol kinase
VSAVRVRAPAKINLHLGVGARRPDGFHELVTVFHAVSLYDEVTVRPAPELRITVTGEGAHLLPTGPGNLAWQAATLLAAHAGVPPNVRVEIAKRIPIAGGLAGGSADAAATLRACARLWGVPDTELPAFAARLGSDVAFALAGGTALGTGRGEVLEPLECAAELHWVLAVAGFGISTATAYATIDELRATGAAPGPRLDVGALRAALAAGNLPAVGALLDNDLQPASVHLAPALADVLAAGRAAGALGGLVSGSGPTCAFLCPSGAAAAALAAHLPGRTLLASGPVPGAAVPA